MHGISDWTGSGMKDAAPEARHLSAPGHDLTKNTKSAVTFQRGRFRWQPRARFKALNATDMTHATVTHESQYKTQIRPETHTRARHCAAHCAAHSPTTLPPQPLERLG